MHLNSGNTGGRLILSLTASDHFLHLLSELFSFLLAVSGRHSPRQAAWPSSSPPKGHTPKMATRLLSLLWSPATPLPAQCRRHQLYFKALPVPVSIELMRMFETCRESPIQISALLLLPDKWHLSVCLWMSSEKWGCLGWGIKPPSNLGQKKYPVEWVLSTVLFFPFNPEAFLFSWYDSFPTVKISPPALSRHFTIGIYSYGCCQELAHPVLQSNLTLNKVTGFPVRSHLAAAVTCVQIQDHVLRTDGQRAKLLEEWT